MHDPLCGLDQYILFSCLPCARIVVTSKKVLKIDILGR
ncbi:MAG: hypothetical protein ACI902_002738 [Psychroserpens sp.]